MSVKMLKIKKVKSVEYLDFTGQKLILTARSKSFLTIIFLLIFTFNSPAFANYHDHKKEHGGQIFHSLELEVQGNENNSDLDFEGSAGNDENKIFLISEIERRDKETEKSEFFALYSHNISEFWDGQMGLRIDSQPDSLKFLTFGFFGLAPYFLETKTHIFLSEEGDFSLRIAQNRDFLITQKLITQPYFEINLSAQNVKKSEIGRGISEGEIGIKTRYEANRKFAPYLDLKYESKFGNSAKIAKNQNDDTDNFIAALGLKILF